MPPAASRVDRRRALRYLDHGGELPHGPTTSPGAGRERPAGALTDSGAAAGLSDAEAEARLARYGPNALVEKKPSALVRLLGYFWGPIPWMIETAAALSAAVGHWADLTIICTMLLANALIGFWEEYKADSAIALLKGRLATQARVRRGGRWSVVPSRDLVPGDLVRVRLGDIAPADVRLVRGDYLEVDQSALTGESLPVERTRDDVVYSGSIVRRGEADGVVTATGMHTFLGRTARLVETSAPASHYQKAVLQIGHFLILTTLGLMGVILLVALFRGTPVLETVRFLLILTVAAIPVALPAVLSVTMAVGAVRLAQRRAIVSRLVSIEEMAGMDVLCSDKTGTLTCNRLVLGEPVPLDVPAADVVQAAALASRAEDRDPIDDAVLERAGSITAEVETFRPFDPAGKRTEATGTVDGRPFRVAKGAPQAIAALCDDAGRVRARIDPVLEDLAAKGYRTLAVARADAAGRWRFLGLLPLFDPPREDSAATIAAARALGVTIKMVTGDHLAIARQIARTLGLGDRILPAEWLDRADVTQAEVERADGFAQVLPEHKHRIVEILQQRGHIVGMTGDGVNDAPALKQADVGVAVSGATDAARSAADLVLTAPGLSVIVDAIRETRRIFGRMNSYAVYRIAETVRVLAFMTLSILIFDFYPVTAVMIIILALLNDVPIMMIAYDNAELPQAPVRWEMPKILHLATILGLLGVVSSFGLFWVGERVLHLDRGTIQTLMFLKLTVAGHMTIYLARTGERHFWTRPHPAAALFWTAEGTQLVATLVAVYGLLMAPIGWTLAGLVWAYALAWFVLNDLLKTKAYEQLVHRASRGKRHGQEVHRPL